MSAVAARPAGGLAELLSRRAFLVTTELVPPRGADGAAVRSRAAELGFADAVNVTDLPGARTRMSALAACALLREQGVRPIMQMTCRDRNALALAADAIGAAALGVEAILPLYGDPIRDEQPVAAEVRDVEAAGLAALLRALGEGRSPEGLEVEPAPQLAVGAAATPGRTGVENLRAKIDAGASFVQTQIVLDADAFAEWLAEMHEQGLTARAAFLPGIVIPTSSRQVERIRGFGAQVAADVAARAEAGEGAAVARELAETLVALPGVAGLHLMPLDSPAAALAELAEGARGAAARAA